MSGRSGCAAFVAALLVAAPAWGSGFQLKEQGAAPLGRAFAGATTGTSGYSTIFFNPAGMTRLDSGGSIELTWVAPTAEFSGSATDLTGASVAGGDGGDAGVDSPVPAAYLLWSASDDLKIGLGLTVPFGLATNYESGWEGRYFALRSELMSINIAPSIAYQLLPGLSIGLGLQAQYVEAELSNAYDPTAFALLTGIGALGNLPDPITTMEGDDWGVGFNLGLMAELGPQTRLGLAYRSRIEHELEGAVTWSNVHPDITAIPALAAATAERAAKAGLVTPDIASIGIHHNISTDWAVMAEAAWTNWSVFDELRVTDSNGSVISQTPENWQDSVFFAVGAEYRPTPRWVLRAGAAYDATPVRDEYRTARIPDEDRYWLSVGLGYRLGETVQVDAGYAHLFVKEATINQQDPDFPNARLTGRYDNSTDLVSISVRVHF